MIRLSVIIPANNEETYLPACLESLTRQELPQEVAQVIEIIVAANACHDRTVEIAEQYRQKAGHKGFGYRVLDIEEGGKLNALNRADEIAKGHMRAYVDADVVLSPHLLRLTLDALSRKSACYVSGELVVAPARSWISQHYAKLWSALPYMTSSVPGAGYFAVNEEGRKRWASFPEIIADDAYVRLLFEPGERIKVGAHYLWPVIEGFSGLVKVRHRQNRGLGEVYERFPHLIDNEDKAPLTFRGLLKLLFKMPVSLAVYCAVLTATRFSGQGARNGQWTRGR